MKRQIFLSILILFLVSTAFPAPGDLDASFGSSGKVIASPISSYDQFLDIHPHPDGGFVCGGFVRDSNGFDQLVIEKRLENGSLDTTFGMSGRIILTASPFGFGTKVAINVQTDGKILAAADTTDNSFIGKIRIVRLNNDGTLDSTFNGSGMIDRAGPYFQYHIAGLEIQTDGKIVLVANTEGNFASQNAIVLTRIETNGTIDLNYGIGGVSTAFTGLGPNPTASAIAADGKIVVAGSIGPSPERGLLMRFDVNGSPDATFDTDGMVQTNLDGDPASITQFDSVAVQTNGRIVVGGIFAYGIFDPSNPDDSVIARYNSNGSLDTSFDGDGFKLLSLQPSGNSDRRIVALAVQSDEAIVAAAGFRTNSSSNPYFQLFDFVFVRCTSNGSLDSGWGTNGRVTTDINGNEDQPTALFIRSDGKVVIAGNLRTSDSNSRLAMTRYIGIATSSSQVTISGRVVSMDGRGLPNVVVSLTDGTSAPLLARSSSFGYFTFVNVEAGRVYALTVNSKRNSFTPQVLDARDDISGLELVALP